MIQFRVARYSIVIRCLNTMKMSIEASQVKSLGSSNHIVFQNASSYAVTV